MKKFILTLVVAFATVITMNAQTQSNYAGSSKWYDNIEIGAKFGAVTLADHFCKDGSLTPMVGVTVDKYLTPWFALGVDARTTIGTGDEYNPHTLFDMVNVSGAMKVNVLDLIGYHGKRHTVEPILYAELGWGHYNCSDCVTLENIYNHESALINVNGTNAYVGLPSEDYDVLRNELTARFGGTLKVNLGKAKAWYIGLDIADVWGNIDNGRLDKKHMSVEGAITVGWNLKTSNGTHAFASARLYDYDEVARLNARINELEGRPVQVVEKTVTNTVTVPTVQNTYQVSFAQNSSVLTDNAKAELDNVPTGATVNIVGTTSPEGSVERNTTLAQERADVVANYLKARGVTVNSATGGENGRKAIVTIE